MENDILNGNNYAILGLLEDLHRFYDNQIARRPPHYFKDGPYLGQ